jgi:ERO1-like protein alpha
MHSSNSSAIFLAFLNCQSADYLEHAEYDTGNPQEDLKTQSLVRELVFNPKIRAACPVPFDEAKLWKGEKGPELMLQIQNQFRNIRYVLKNDASALIMSSI